MDRRDEINTNPHPCKRFLEWRGKDKNFRYWDKERGEKGENVVIELPLKFLVLAQFATIKGWHDPSGSGIYSNEVKDTTTDELHVRSFKGGTIAKGIYSVIKPEVYQAGGKYFRSIYVMDEKGEILNLSLQGPALVQWGEFYAKTNRKRALDEWVEIEEAEERKKGSNIFYVPVFKFGGVISETDDTTAQILYKELRTYTDGYAARQKNQEEQEEEDEEPYEDPEIDYQSYGNPRPQNDTLPF